MSQKLKRTAPNVRARRATVVSPFKSFLSVKVHTQLTYLRTYRPAIKFATVNHEATTTSVGARSLVASLRYPEVNARLRSVSRRRIPETPDNSRLYDDCAANFALMSNLRQ